MPFALFATLFSRARTRYAESFHLPHGPDGWQMAVSAYAACQGALWVLNPGLFGHLPGYAFLAVQPFSQALWGLVLLVYALTSLVCLLVSKGSKRAALGIVGTMIWLYLGTEILTASLTSGWRDLTGLFELLAGAGCAVATMQLAHAP